MEREWELDRMELFQLWREHRDWTLPRLGKTLKRSLSWVKKWLKRFRETESPTLVMFKSQSRAPHYHARQITRIVRDAILDFRDQLKDVYGRVVGPKTILFHLQPSTVACTRCVFASLSTYNLAGVTRRWTHPGGCP